MARTVNLLATTPFKSLRPTAPTAVESALATTIATRPSQAISVEGWRGARISFISNGANDETTTFTLYALDPFVDLDGSPGNKGWRCQSLGTLALTLGTSTAVAGTIEGNAAYRWADTITWSASTYGTALLTYVGGNAAAFSPADNTIAEFLISDFGNWSHIALVATTYGLTATSKIYPVGKLDV